MKKHLYYSLLLILTTTQLFAQGNFLSRIGSDIAAYFNTYYNAKVYFNDAQEMYNGEENKNELSTQTRSALNKAARQADVVIEKFPRSSYVDDATFFNSVCQFQLGRYERAIQQLETLTLRYPDSPYYFEAKLWISKSYFQMGKKTIAYDLLEQFLENSSNREYFADAYSLMGYLALQEGDSLKAREAFIQSAEKASHKDVSCNMYLEAVNILIDRGEYAEALKYTDRAGRNIKFDEQRARVQIAYIRIYRLQNDDSKAEELIAASLKDARIAKYWGDIMYEQANILFEKGSTKEAVGRLRYVVEDPDNTFRNVRESEAWARSAYRLGQYYLLETANLDSAEFYFKRAQTKRKQSKEGSLATEVMVSVTQLRMINKKLSGILKNAPELADSAWFYYELLADSARAEENMRNRILADTLAADSSRTDSLIHVANTEYQQYQARLSFYLEHAGDYVEELFNLAGLFLFDLHMPDTALSIYQKISREYYFTAPVTKALYSQAYVWEYEMNDRATADSVKGIITRRFPDSEITDFILNRVPQDSVLYYENQEKIFRIEKDLIDKKDYSGAVDALKALLKSNRTDKKNKAFIAYKIAWLYDYELSRSEDTKDSTLHYYHLVSADHSASPLARQSSLRIAAIETDIRNYTAYLSGDSLQTTTGDTGHSMTENVNLPGKEERSRQHPLKRLQRSPGRPRPQRL